MAMKFTGLFVLLLGARASTLEGSPVGRVVDLLNQIKSKITDEGKSEQQEYDKYACWVEDTLGRKATDISDAKKLIAELLNSIKEEKAAVATHSAEIENLNRLIAENKESTKDSNAQRSKNNGAFRAEKVELENAMGALESAIRVLTGAGTGKSFLAASQQANLLSVAADVRGVLNIHSLTDSVSDDDLLVVQQFVSSPKDFVQPSKAAMAQVGQNPFGDYAPQSGQIQGILKSFYDSMATDLEKANAEEGDQQRNYEALTNTKSKELKSLQKSLESHTTERGAQAEQLAEDQAQLKATQDELAASEKLFEETTKMGKNMAAVWSERTRLRSTELQGIIEAINILEGDSDNFKKSHESFLQVRMSKNVVAKLQNLAKKSNSAAGHVLAASLSSGNFNVVSKAIEGMLQQLRVEEKQDLEEKKTCEANMQDNENDLADAEKNIDDATKKLSDLDDTRTQLEEQRTSTEEKINQTKTEMAELLDERNTENAEFQEALKSDQQAVETLTKALAALSEFYKDGPKFFIQIKGPEYSVDKDKPPAMSFDNKEYGSKSSETSGPIALLEMIREDIMNEMQESKDQEAENEEEYDKLTRENRAVLKGLVRTKTEIERKLANNAQETDITDEYKTAQENAKADQEDRKTALTAECSWLELYDSRKEKRKTEMDGLVKAKNYLAENGMVRR